MSSVLGFGILLASLVLFVVPPAASARQVHEPSAEEILAKLESRIGQPDARAKIRNVVGRGSAESGCAAGKAAMEWINAGTEGGRITVTYPDLLLQFGNAGGWSWSLDPMTGITVRDGAAQGGVQRLFAVSRRAPWKEIYARAEKAGTEEVEKRRAWKLRMIPAEGDRETWYVDAETHDLLRIDLKMPDPLGGQLAMEWLFSDYKPVNGVLFPFTRTQRIGTNMAVQYAFDSIETPETLDAKCAAPPKEALEAHANPSKKGPNEALPAGACELREIVRQPTATIRVTIKESEVSETLAVVFGEVFTLVQKAGANMSGPPFTRYHSMRDGTVDIEVGIPVKPAITGEGRVKASELPAGRAAMTWHHGPYQELPKSYGLLDSWMKQKGLVADGGHWENYWTDPGIEPDPAKWRTQIFWPVK